MRVLIMGKVTFKRRELLVAGCLSMLVMPSCKSLDATMQSADVLRDFANSSTGQSIANIAKSDDPRQALKDQAKVLQATYKNNPQALLADYNRLREQYKQLRLALKGKASEQWGAADSKTPEVTTYVKYTRNYKSRAVVDFDSGKVVVETLEQSNYTEALKSAIVTTLLTPDDPRAVDLFTDAEVDLSSKQDPYLLNLILDTKQKAINTPQQAAMFADWLINNAQKSKAFNTENGFKTAHFVEMNMVSNFSDKQAEKYLPTVKRFADKFGVNESLIFGVIRTESNFNPFAVSAAPAFGLMQLVPSSGGRDAYKEARGIDQAPTQDFLFDANNNIELGTAYIGVLLNNYLGKVNDHISREYCAIASYNTGAGNTFKAFGGDRTTAISAINTMTPPQVYDTLVTKLPYEETRSYVQKVVKFRKNYVQL